VIMPGHRRAVAGAYDLFQVVSHKLGIPVALTWTAIDLMANDDALFLRPRRNAGRSRRKLYGPKCGYFAGAGEPAQYSPSQYNWESFARQAFKIQVDVDPAELQKPTVKPEWPIPCDLKLFLEEMNRQIGSDLLCPSTSTMADLVPGPGRALSGGCRPTPAGIQEDQPLCLHRKSVYPVGGG